MTVDKKQAPTPINIAEPRLANPRQTENIKEPNHNIEKKLSNILKGVTIRNKR